MEQADLKKVLAGFGLTTLLAGVVLGGCTGTQKSAPTAEKGGGANTGSQQQAPAPSS